MSAYWMGRIRVTDEAAYGEYAKRAGPAVAEHGGKFLVRGGKHVTLEGGDYPRNVIVEFPSFDQAVACYNSPAYQDALSFQKDAAERLVCVVEGA